MKNWKIKPIEITLDFDGDIGHYSGDFDIELEDDLSAEFVLVVRCKLIREYGYEPYYDNIEIQIENFKIYHLYLRRITLPDHEQRQLITQIKEQVVWS